MSKNIKWCFFLGLNYDQLPYLVELRNQGYKIIGCDKNPTCVGRDYCSKFINYSYDDVKNVFNHIQSLRNIKVDFIFSAASQRSQILASLLADHYKVKYPSTQNIQKVLDKFKTYPFFTENNIRIPHTTFIVDKSSINKCLNKADPNANYFVKSDYSKNPNYVYSGKPEQLMEKNYVWKNDDFFQCGYVMQEEFVGNHYRVNLLSNSIIVFLVKPCERTTGYNWKTDRFNLIRKLVSATDNLGMKHWILKFDIIISDADYVALDIGVDPPFRLKKP